jgi:hypothetical protein
VILTRVLGAPSPVSSTPTRQKSPAVASPGHRPRPLHAPTTPLTTATSVPTTLPTTAASGSTTLTTTAPATAVPATTAPSTIRATTAQASSASTSTTPTSTTPTSTAPTTNTSPSSGRSASAQASSTVVDATEAFPGTFTYPNDVATTLSIPSAGGRVRVTVTAAGSTSLKLTIACRGSSTRTIGGDGLAGSMTSVAGTCRISLEDGDTTPGVAHRFVMHVHYPVTDPGGGRG